MRPAVAIEGVGKRYVISHEAPERYTALRDVLTRMIMSLPRKIARPAQSPDAKHEAFWALRNVSAQVLPGERVGIIGRNGAGKTTLLKLLSRITAPTEGRVRLFGRVASLLEVGTGFHPELTGRENIFLNGAILGMSRKEIQSKFDEIVAFAEVERFLDTPVKRYSSGMYVRLAFAVAAHLEPEILLVDEVLAVGDLSFQSKCLSKMQDVASSGRTVLFVSHNMAAIHNLCSRCILLDHGTVVADGPTGTVIDAYINSGLLQRPEFTAPHQPQTKAALRRICVETLEGGPLAGEFRYDRPCRIAITYEINERVNDVSVWFDIRTLEGSIIFGTADTDRNPGLLDWREPALYHAVVPLPERLLNAGRYTVHAGIARLSSQTTFDRVSDAVSFSILDVGTPAVGRPGILAPFFSWETHAIDS